MTDDFENQISAMRTQMITEAHRAEAVIFDAINASLLTRLAVHHLQAAHSEHKRLQETLQGMLPAPTEYRNGVSYGDDPFELPRAYRQ